MDTLTAYRTGTPNASFEKMPTVPARVFLLVCCMFCLPARAQPLQKRHVPSQPYDRYVVTGKEPGDSVTYYLSEFAVPQPAPLVVYVQGSGNGSLFAKDADGRIGPKAGHISWAYALQGRARLLIVEKPGVRYLDQAENNAAFDMRFSLESWVRQITTAIDCVLQNEKIDRTRIMIAGHSEGGLVAAGVAAAGLVSHVAVLAGEGPSQLYSLYRLAGDGHFFDAPGFTAKDRLDSLDRVWKAIQADPLSTEKKFWGFSYLRWSSFLRTSVMEQLSAYQGRIRIVQGDADRNVYPESAKVLYTSLLSKGRDVSLDIVPNADHSFNIEGNPQVNGWQNMIQQCIAWFLGKE